MVVSMINSSVLNKIPYNLFQPDSNILNVMPVKQENSLKGFSSFRTVKDTAERFTRPVLQEYVVIFCQLQSEP